MKTIALDKALKILLLLFLIFAALYFAKPFLAPFTIALLLAMLFHPLTARMERKGLARGWAVFLSVLILVAAITGVFFLIYTQVSGMAEDIPKMKQNASQYLTKVKAFISSTAGISTEKQQQMLEEQQSGGGSKAASQVAGFLGALSGVLVDTILVLVYLFLLLFFRTQLQKAILAMVPAGGQQKAMHIIRQSVKVAGKYLSGLAIMIGMLWVMYGIGFSIVGVKNALFFAVLCGLLEIVPFVGNITGTAATMLMALSQGGGGGIVLGVLVVYLVVQFIQTYLIEPLVVGSEVSINPLFTIIVLVVGELIWGIPGMVVAIPMLGIVKVICDNVDDLKPIGMLIGKEEKKGKSKGIVTKIKSWFKKK
ncbi:MAG: AI-2E family transporter [Bacteroidota bacterium]